MDSSRSRWKWLIWRGVTCHAPLRWKGTHGQNSTNLHPEQPTRILPESSSRSAWARLIALVYQVDPLVCPRCALKMRVLAVITDAAEVKKILRHLNQDKAVLPQAWIPRAELIIKSIDPTVGRARVKISRIPGHRRECSVRTAGRPPRRVGRAAPYFRLRVRLPLIRDGTAVI